MPSSAEGAAKETAVGDKMGGVRAVWGDAAVKSVWINSEKTRESKYDGCAMQAHHASMKLMRVDSFVVVVDCKKCGKRE